MFRGHQVGILFMSVNWRVGICTWGFIESPPTVRVQKIQSLGSGQVEVTVLKNNIPKLYFCGRSPDTEPNRLIELSDKV